MSAPNAVQAIVSRMLAPIKIRVQTMIVRAVVELVKDDTKLQSLQVSALGDDPIDDVERFQQYGFTSVPSKDAEALLMFLGSSPDHPVIVSVDDRNYRVTGLSEGEVALYTKQNAKRIYLKSDGKILIGTDPTQFAARADKVLDELNKIKNYLTTMAGVFSSPVPEAGLGAPSSLGTALNLAHQSINPSTLATLQAPAAEEVQIK